MSSQPTSLPVRSEQDFGEASQLPAVWHLMGADGLPQRLLVLAKMIERVTSRQLQGEFALSVAQWRVLAFTCISGPATAAYIGEASEADPAEISRAVKTLVEKGLVTRKYEAGSRKTMVIAPTEAGTELFQQVRRRRRAYFAQITDGLGTEEKAEFDRMMTTLGQSVIAERDGR